jgi:hypothetical protein
MENKKNLSSMGEMLCRIEFIEYITERKIMAKKSKSSGKGETSALDTELYIPTPESGGIISFYYLFGGIGILMTIFMIIYLVLRYVFHIL